MEEGLVSGEGCLQFLHELVGFPDGETERGQQADDVRPAGSGEHMMVVDEAVAQLLHRTVELHAEHQALAAHFTDAGQGTQLLQQVLAHTGGVLHEVFALHHVEHGEGGGTAQVVAAERRAQLTVGGGELRADEHSAHREAIGDTFCHGDEVGADAGVLVGKEPSAASVTRLDLVEDEEGAGLVAQAAQALQEGGVGDTDAAHALDALDDDGTHVSLLQLGAGALKVVQLEEGHMPVGVDGGDDGGVLRRFHGERGPSVERLGEGHHARPSVVERGELECILVGLRSGIDEEEAVVFVAGRLAESLGKLALQQVDDGVGVETQHARLAAHCLHIVRVGVTDGDDGMAAVEVQVLRAPVVPDTAALALDDVDVKQGIYVEQIHSLRIMTGKWFVSEGAGLQPQSHGLLQVEQQVHVVDRLSAGTLQEVVDAGDDEQLVAVLLQVDEALVGVDHLLQVDILLHDVDEGVLGVVLLVDAFELLKRHLRLHHQCGEDAAGEVAPVGDEVNLRVEAVLQLAERLLDFRHVLVGESLVDADVVVAPAEVARRARFHACSRAAGDGVHRDVAVEQEVFG